MSIQNYKCLICNKPMAHIKPAKIELNWIFEDGTTDRIHSSFMICQTCHNIQLFADIFRDDILPSQSFKENQIY